jgi:hypothetical protein
MQSRVTIFDLDDFVVGRGNRSAGIKHLQTIHDGGINWAPAAHGGGTKPPNSRSTSSAKAIVVRSSK